MFNRETILKSLNTENYYIDKHSLDLFLEDWKIESIYEDDDGIEFYDDLALEKIKRGISLKAQGFSDEQIITKLAKIEAKIEKYDETKTYMFPNGELATPERVKKDYPAVSVFPHIVETDEAGQVMFAIQNLAAIKSQMGIDPSTSEEESINQIEEIRNAPAPEPEVSAEERIAAALEFNNILNM